MKTPAPVNRRVFLALAAGSFTVVVLCRTGAVKAAPTPASATALVKSTGDRLVAIIGAPGTPQEKQPRFAQVIDTAVDADAVAKFSLGRFWRTATPKQQKQYTSLFHSVLTNNITSKLGEYRGVTFTVQPAVPREGNAFVTTTIERPGNAPTKLEWVVSDESGAPRVIDVIAEGTSLRLTKRNDYAAYLSRNGDNVQTLIDAMKQQLAGSG